MKWVWLLAALVPTSAQAAPDWHGVWQGTIATLPVRACLQERGEGISNGSYFYLSRMKPIALSREADGAWSEQMDGGAASSGRWVLSAAASGRLAGTWRGGGRTLPIALTRVPVTEADENPCGTAAYIAPRLRAAGIVSKPATKDGFAFTQLTYDVGPGFPEVSITSFAFPPTRPGDRVINAALRIDPAKPDGEADYAGCMKMALGSSGRDGDFHFLYTPDLVTPEFLSVTANIDGFCGGAHPSESTWHLTFDRANGKRIDLARWFTLRGVAAGEDDSSIRKITPALRALVLKRFSFGQGEDPECREVVSGEDFWELALARRGIAFTPSLPRVIRACAETTVVPFADLAPFLGPDGRQEAARLMR